MKYILFIIGGIIGLIIASSISDSEILRWVIGLGCGIAAEKIPVLFRHKKPNPQGQSNSEAETKESKTSDLNDDVFDYSELSVHASHERLLGLLKAYISIVDSYVMYTIVDESRLPCEKAVMKAVLKSFIRNNKGSEVHDEIRDAYLWLAKFQPDSASIEKLQRNALESYEKELGDKANIIGEQEKMMGIANALDKVLDWKHSRIVRLETEILEQELTKFDLDGEI